ncbi:hypothetical protein FA13DRAFT_997194 [Coprinellus micaceus]|uniref:DUF6699 domain-containing protein n=1 Tax=Coprinellus micaceus TaxID=71717 RepID=A0A4Y7SYC3_COPMI|nr:hypothetical protein FA13DRAFT_997194 [Coprinellus micaceus]
MAITQHTSAYTLDTPCLSTVSLPPRGPRARHCVLHPSLTLTGSLRRVRWLMTRPAHPDAVNDNWDAPACFPYIPEMEIWIPDWQLYILVRQTTFSFVTVRDVLARVHDIAQSVLEGQKASNQTEPAGLLFSNNPAPQVTASGWRWAGLTASVVGGEEWVLAVVG